MSIFLLAELNEVLDRLRQGLSQSPQRVETSDTSGDETDASQGHRKVLSKKIFLMKKVYAATELGRFIVTGPLDAANMPSHFYCRLCRKNVSVLTHGHHEILRHFQGRRHFARAQRLRLETPGWCVLDFQGNPLNEDELERQRKKIQKLPKANQNFFETLKNCIEPSSQRVHNCYCLRVLTIFNQSFIFQLSFVSQF